MMHTNQVVKSQARVATRAQLEPRVALRSPCLYLSNCSFQIDLVLFSHGGGGGGARDNVLFELLTILGLLFCMDALLVFDPAV